MLPLHYLWFKYISYMSSYNSLPGTACALRRPCEGSRHCQDQIKLFKNTCAYLISPMPITSVWHSWVNIALKRVSHQCPAPIPMNPHKMITFYAVLLNWITINRVQVVSTFSDRLNTLQLNLLSLNLFLIQKANHLWLLAILNFWQGVTLKWF